MANRSKVAWFERHNVSTCEFADGHYNSAQFDSLHGVRSRQVVDRGGEPVVARPCVYISKELNQ